MVTSKDKTIEVLGQERRRRWSIEEKLAMVREGLEPGLGVSVVARRNGINPNQLFHRRKLYQDGSLSAFSAGEAVVPASELADALKQIRELQRMLGKKTMEAEILKEAVEIARSRKWIAHSPLLPRHVREEIEGRMMAFGLRVTLYCRWWEVYQGDPQHPRCRSPAACRGGVERRHLRFQQRPGHQLFKIRQEAIPASQLLITGIFQFGKRPLHGAFRIASRALSVPRVGTVDYFCSCSLDQDVFQKASSMVTV